MNQTHRENLIPQIQEMPLFSEWERLKLLLLTLHYSPLLFNREMWWGDVRMGKGRILCLNMRAFFTFVYMQKVETCRKKMNGKTENSEHCTLGSRILSFSTFGKQTLGNPKCRSQQLFPVCCLAYSESSKWGPKQQSLESITFVPQSHSKPI